MTRATKPRPLATRRQIVEVLRKWAADELRAYGSGYNGNPVLEVPSACRRSDCDQGIEINLERLAIRIENAIQDGVIKLPEVAA